MYVPTIKEDLRNLGWSELDIILITGDTYIDISNDGTALLAKYLISKNYRVGIIAQPRIDSDIDISRLGEPRLFWGVSAGCVDSMVANYTSLNKKRTNDDLTPGGINNLRPDRATVIYTNLIKRYYKSRKPIVLGGIEASLRRISHYDYWTDTIRRSVLCDSKADALIYGMGEKAILEFAQSIEFPQDFKSIKGLCYLSNTPPEDYIELPSYEIVKKDKNKFTEMFNTFYQNTDPLNSKGLYQKVDNRYWIQNPPQNHLTESEIDEVYALEFERDAHPYYKNQGEIKALQTVRFSITSHRGCFGECNFCAIASHQGRRIISRSKKSIINEVKTILLNKNFKGIIFDVGGATANMYKMECNIQSTHGSCKNKSCIFPNICKNMNIDHINQINMLKELRSIDGIKKIFISSGLRYDLIMGDMKNGKAYLRELVNHHISGQLKIAPEHIDNDVLNMMRKPNNNNLIEFIREFKLANQESGKNQFLTYYFIASHPGCTQKSTNVLKDFIKKELICTPEQIQIFTPTPSTYSTLQYYTGKSQIDGSDIYVEKKNSKKAEEKKELQELNTKYTNKNEKAKKNRGSGRQL